MPRASNEGEEGRTQCPPPWHTVEGVRTVCSLCGWLGECLPPPDRDRSLHPADPCPLCLQLYELDTDPKRKEFLDDLFSFMQKRGEHLPGQEGMMGN